MDHVKAARLDLANLVAEACAPFAALAAAKNLSLHTSFVDGEKVWFGDQRQISKALSLLVENAVRHTDAGCVSVTVEPAPEGLYFAVADTGPGFQPFQIPAFYPFGEALAPISRNLIACREIVMDEMAGYMSADSTPGGGSAFTFTLALTSYAGENCGLFDVLATSSAG